MAKPKPKALPSLHVVSPSKSGRPKQPLEKRKVLSDHPHKGRISPPDVEMSVVVEPEELPSEPPKPLSPAERECWDMIVGTQTGRRSKWIYRSDCSHLMATCVLYGRMMEVREEINAARDGGVAILDPETNKANPLYALEANIAVKFQASLRDLGLVPTRRQVSLAPDEEESEPDGLLK